jgi:hypothetical protein
MFSDDPALFDKSTGATGLREQNPEWDITVPDHHLGIDFDLLAPYNTETVPGQALPKSMTRKLLQNALVCSSIDHARIGFLPRFRHIEERYR